MVRHEVVIAVYDGIQLLDAAGPLEVFDGAAQILGDGYRVRLASLGGRDVLTSSRVRLGVETALEAIDDVGTLVVAGGWGFRDATFDTALIGQIRRLAGLAERTTSVCSGAFLLAEAGLLDGRRATTHWSMCDELAVSYPTVTVEPDAIYVRDEPLVTAAGVTAGVDLALALVEDDHGAELARKLAKYLVVFLQRPGGQSQFSVWSSAPAVSDRALRELLGDITARPAGDYSIPAMAARLAMSPRHLGYLGLHRFPAAGEGRCPGREARDDALDDARGAGRAGRRGHDRAGGLRREGRDRCRGVRGHRHGAVAGRRALGRGHREDDPADAGVRP